MTTKTVTIYESSYFGNKSSFSVENRQCKKAGYDNLAALSPARSSKMATQVPDEEYEVQVLGFSPSVFIEAGEYECRKKQKSRVH